MSEDCLVCREHRLEVPLPGGLLVSTRDVVAFHLPPWPPTAADVYLGYLMVTPRRHVADFAGLTDDESAAIGQWITRLSRSLKAIGAERVYLAVVGHVVPHLHVHLVPRWPGTPEDLSWQEVDSWEARRGDVTAATEVVERLRHQLGEGLSG